MNTEQLFEELERDSSTVQSGTVYRRVLPDSPFDVRLEIVVPSRRRCLAVVGPKPASAPEVTEMRGLEVVYCEEDQALRVEVVDVRFSQLFSALANDLLLALTRMDATANPVAVTIDRMSLWRRLFEDLQPEGLTLEQQRGLYCELLCLLRVVMPALGKSGGVEAWVAPHHSAQDFQVAAVAIEVKSRFRKAESRVRISSEEQLDAHGRTLFLVVYALDKVEAGGQSLNELVDHVRCELDDSPVAQMAFADSLVRVGYLDVHRDRYAEPAYVAAATMFWVAEEFPRIVPGRLDAGVMRVSYDLDLASCVGFSTGESTVIDALRGTNV